MKEAYEGLEMETVMFETEDVIVCSGEETKIYPLWPDP